MFCDIYDLKQSQDSRTLTLSIYTPQNFDGLHYDNRFKVIALRSSHITSHFVNICK